MMASINESEEVYSLNDSIHVIIFNTKYFRNSSDNKRNGSEKDVERLSIIFRDLNYKVETKLELESNEVRECIKDYAQKDYSQVSCLIMFIMSHGDKNKVTAADSNNIYIEEFIDPFKENRSLKNKPKLFFIQSCRGKKKMASIDQIESDFLEHYETDLNRVPKEADILISYSTVEGFYSYRDPKSGSWYIQTLCDVISEQKNDDILSILTKVNSLMSKKENEKVVPEFTSRLTKKFYFKGE
jgi:hypothetical protein